MATFHRSAFACAVFASLAACGGGGGGSSSPAVPAAQTPASAPAPASSTAAPPAISATFEGDSTMFGIGAGSGQSEPDDIGAILAGVTINNAGISGTWTQENLDGTAPFTTPLATRLAVDPSQIVVMNYGINDSHEVDLNTYEQNLFDWVRTVRSFGKVPVFEEPNPSTIASYQAVLPDYVAAMDRAAQQLNVPVVPQYYRMQQIPNWQSLLADGLHPNAQGYAVKAQATAEVLKTVIASLH